MLLCSMYVTKGHSSKKIGTSTQWKKLDKVRGSLFYVSLKLEIFTLRNKLLTHFKFYMAELETSPMANKNKNKNNNNNNKDNKKSSDQILGGHFTCILVYTCAYLRKTSIFWQNFIYCLNYIHVHKIFFFAQYFNIFARTSTVFKIFTVFYRFMSEIWKYKIEVMLLFYSHLFANTV